MGLKVPKFDRSGVEENSFSQIGDGSIGVRARRLFQLATEVLPSLDFTNHPDLQLEVPRLVVIAGDVFSEFMDRNRLWDLVGNDHEDRLIARTFQDGDVPPRFLEDLRAIVRLMPTPLAVRSSSSLEDDEESLFVGTYTTKMISNNEATEAARIARFGGALKLVWASAFFADAEVPRRAAGRRADEERMAVMVQEVVGLEYGPRFYPTLSGVARSHNVYPPPGWQDDDGEVSLVLGLGKTVIEGGKSWSYPPPRPLAPPPFRNTTDLLKSTQTSFWAVNMAPAEAPDPLHDSERLVRVGLRGAEVDGCLRFLASTYDRDSDQLRAGLSGKGPRAVTFAPLLGSKTIPFTEVVDKVLQSAVKAFDSEVTVEFAATLGPDQGLPLRFGVLGVRPLFSRKEAIAVKASDLTGSGLLMASDQCLGNGSRNDIMDVVYLRPETFDAGLTRSIAAELDAVNRSLAEECRPAVFIGFGRWGSSDERCGVPVVWRQISTARVLVESSLPGLRPAPSGGSHFFSRVLAAQVLCLAAEHDGGSPVDWTWLDQQSARYESRHVRHVRLERPLTVTVDGSSGRGLIRMA